MGFNQFMTFTSYVFGIGVLIYGIRNGDKVASAIGGVYGAATGAIRDIATIG